MGNEQKWYQKSLRRLLVDMHIPDWNGDFLKEISPENYAEMLALAKVDTAENLCSPPMEQLLTGLITLRWYFTDTEKIPTKLFSVKR